VRRHSVSLIIILLSLLCVKAWCGSDVAEESTHTDTTTPLLIIPRLAHPPLLEDFLSMHPEGETAQKMVAVTGFVQRDPQDGKPVSEATTAYLGYDDKNLYAIFVCFDDPHQVRARLSRREDIYDDDQVEIILDTFHDMRRAYMFQTTPLGVQWDAMWTEQPFDETSGNIDTSFDTVWDSRGQLTSKGYVVRIAIPFRSLRFPNQQKQTWGIMLYRGITRKGEDAFWPHISLAENGRLKHAARLEGLEGVSPGEDMQLIPYTLLRSFRALDDRDPLDPHFYEPSLAGQVGVDGKFILHNNFVVDVTANPDFSQVESDDPQITEDQRFAVYFPEKRPFFQENADFFRTPIDLFFTRNIEDPSAGIRLTGKEGPYSVGILASDDRAPGLSVTPDDTLAGSRAYFTIARLKRDIFQQSSIGVIYTDREYPIDGEFNRVGGIDSHLKFDENWTGNFQAVVSSTRNADGSYQAGPAYKAEFQRSGEHFTYDGIYNDVSPGFVSEPGFVNRVDLRENKNTLQYLFRTNNSWITAWGPGVLARWAWAHDGLRLDTEYDPLLAIQMKAQSYVEFFPYDELRERLRPSDFSTLTQNEDFHEHNSAVYLLNNFLKKASFGASYVWGDGLNIVTPTGVVPMLASTDIGSATLNFRPINPLKIENTYLLERLRDRETGQAVFNNHILQSKWNWQFTRDLSLRAIMEYNSTLANPIYTSLQTTKQFNADFLITYLVHPGTALYIGYNSDLQNLDRGLDVDPATGLINRSPTGYINDGRQFFVKVSYLLQR
jgi:hypothetical protein